MNESKHTPGPWINGCGNGITGPTTPTRHPTCEEAVEFHEYCDDPKNVVFPKPKHTVVSCGKETIAIIPLNGVGGETKGKANAQLIAAVPALLEALKNLQKVIREHGLLDIKKRFSLCNADAQANAAIALTEKEG